MDFIEIYKEDIYLLYDYLGFNNDNAKKDAEEGKLSMKELNNGRDIIWYKDENVQGIIYTNNHDILTDDEAEAVVNGEMLSPQKKLSLKEVMDDRNISVKELSSATGIATRSLYDYVNDANMHVTSMDADRFWRIAEVLQLSIEEIRKLLQIEKFELYSVHENQEDLLAESFELDKIISAYFHYVDHCDNLEIRRLATYNSYGDETYPICDYDIVNLNTIKANK